MTIGPLSPSSHVIPPPLMTEPGLSVSTPTDTLTTAAAPKKKSDLLPRLLTSVIAIPVLLYSIFIARSPLLAAIVLFAAMISTWEYLNITLKEYTDFGWLRYLGLGLSGFLFAVLYWGKAYTLFALALVVILPFIVLLFTFKERTDYTKLYGATLTGIVYGTLPISALALLQLDTGPSSGAWVLIALGLTWGSDTFAYFGGRAFGKRKLSPRISPNKTIEGTISGLFGSIFFGIALNELMAFAAGPRGYDSNLFGLSALPVHLEWQALSLPQILLLALPANAASQLGDLAESAIKRAHDVKDSGVIVYGHGGILDRIDGLMFSVPWVYYCAVVLFVSP